MHLILDLETGVLYLRLSTSLWWTNIGIQFSACVPVLRYNVKNHRRKGSDIMAFWKWEITHFFYFNIGQLFKTASIKTHILKSNGVCVHISTHLFLNLKHILVQNHLSVRCNSKFPYQPHNKKNQTQTTTCCTVIVKLRYREGFTYLYRLENINLEGRGDNILRNLFLNTHCK